MARGEMRSALAALALAALGACTTSQQVKAPDATTVESQGVAPSAADMARFAEIVAAHNVRAARLETLESRASLELRYSDQDGDHFDQCEADIFLASGGRGALRATKVGNNILWVGSDGTRGWIFRLDSKPTRLTVFEGIGALPPGQRLAGDGAAEFSLLSPGAVRTIAGIAPIAEGWQLRPIDGVAAASTIESRLELVSALSADTDAVFRFTKGGLPESVRIEPRGAKPILLAALSEYVPAQVENLSQGAWPQVPRKIVVTGVAAAGAKDSEARLYLDAPIAMAKRMKPRFFVLDELVGQLRPDAVEHIVVGAGADEPR
jgi:hypothetical protein